MIENLISEYFTKVFRTLYRILSQRTVMLIMTVILNLLVNALHTIELINDATAALSLKKFY